MIGTFRSPTDKLTQALLKGFVGAHRRIVKR
jgi:hypothetical protein